MNHNQFEFIMKLQLTLLKSLTPAYFQFSKEKYNVQNALKIYSQPVDALLQAFHNLELTPIGITSYIISTQLDLEHASL